MAMLAAGVMVGVERPCWESGDLLTLRRTGDPRRWLAPEELLSGEIACEQILAADGTPLQFSRNLAQHGFDSSDLVRVAGERSSLRLEFVSHGCFRVRPAANESAPERDGLATESGVPIVLASDEDRRLLDAGPTGIVGLDDFQLAVQAARIGIHGSFDQLLCLPLLREMDLLEHQLKTAKTVLRRFRGRAMLCDEVGLGKTVEAGLILSELHMRGLARSVLVLTPPSLIEQWQGELRRKFSLDFTSYDDPQFRERGVAAWTEFDRILVSTHTAKREPHRSAITARNWDLVIVDEAHHLRNRTTQLWKFASELQKQYMLLLTATPVQNNLDELFNLVTLLEPGLLRTAKQFQKQFVDKKDKLMPRNVEQLHELLSEVMVRNRRSTVGLQFTRRWAKTLSVRPSPEEARLYGEVTALVKDQLRTAEEKKTRPAEGAARRPTISRMALLSLQMALGSSPQAAAGTLATLADDARLPDDVREQLMQHAELAARQPPGTKVERLLGLLGEFDDKMVIFTQFRATQAMLAQALRDAGHAAAVFHGGLSRLEKEAAVREFRGPARLLLCTEAGSEGRNLQFAHAVCNFDLPWNPMKIEQRIGRLSRIGQQHDVLVFNLVAAGTVEAAVLHLLDAKLSMFELVIGEIDMILGNLEEDQEFHDVVADLWAESNDSDDFTRRIDHLGDRLLAAKQAYLEQRAHDDRIFGTRFAPQE